MKRKIEGGGVRHVSDNSPTQKLFFPLPRAMPRSFLQVFLLVRAGVMLLPSVKSCFFLFLFWDFLCFFATRHHGLRVNRILICLTMNLAEAVLFD